MIPGLSIGITTRNRPASLAHAVASVRTLEHMRPELLVYDDGSQPPALAESAGPTRILRDATAPGYIVGRNRLVGAASAPLVLLLDDDVRILSSGAVERAIEIMNADPAVAAIAFAQAEATGEPWPPRMQPSLADTPSVVASFIGFAHLLRRDVFLSLGGYREEFEFYGEEKDYCLRLIDAGFKTVYLPDALIAHVPDSAGRSRSRYLRFVSRNDCLAAMYNDPLPLLAVSLPARILLYLHMRRGMGIPDPGGFPWLLGQVARGARRALRDGRRRPVAWRTIRRWRALRRDPEAYPCAS